jgi:hypothetical protein
MQSALSNLKQRTSFSDGAPCAGNDGFHAVMAVVHHSSVCRCLTCLQALIECKHIVVKIECRFKSKRCISYCKTYNSFHIERIRGWSLDVDERCESHLRNMRNIHGYLLNQG